MEKNIYNIIKELYVKNYTEKNNNNISDIVINKFISTYFAKYKEFLFDNAVIYSIRKNNYMYLNLINKYNVNFKLNNDDNFKYVTTMYALFNIHDKLVKKINEDENIKENNINIFNYKNTKIDTLSMIYRKWIIDLINLNEDKEIYEVFDIVFHTTKYDKDLFELSKGMLNEKNILKYKNILIRLILSDNYLHLKSLVKEDEIDKKIYEINLEYNPTNNDLYSNNLSEESVLYDEDRYEEDQYFDTISSDNDRLISKEEIEVLNFIEDFLDNNKFNIEEFKRMRNIIYNTFAWYNLEIAMQKYDIETIKTDKEIIKKLKKINPLYFLDNMNLDN